MHVFRFARARTLVVGTGLAVGAFVLPLPHALASVSPASATFTLAPGGSATELKTVGVPAVPPRADIELAIDTTGSMSGGIADAKNNATTVMNSIIASGVDANFAVVQFKDFCTASVPTSGPGCSYADGSFYSGDYPEYQVVQQMTPSASAVTAALGTLTANGGGDAAEAHNLVINKAYSAPDNQIGWRTGTKKIVILISDAAPHHSSLLSASCSDTSADPHGLSTAVETAALVAHDRTLFTVFEPDGGASTTEACLDAVANAGGGSGVTAGTGTALGTTLINLINSAFATVKNVHMEVASAGPAPAAASWISFSPGSVGPVPAPSTQTFTVGMTVPSGTPSGTYHFDLVALADGQDIGHQALTIVVDSPPTVSAGGPSYAGSEGSPVALSGTASDDHAGLITTWSYAPGAGVDAGAACVFANANAPSTTVTCTDDGSYTLTLTANDGVNPPVVSAPATLTLGNVAPVISGISPVSGSLYAVGTPVTVTMPFSDAGTNDTHTCTVNWDDGLGPVAGTVTETNGAGACTSTNSALTSDVFSITGTVTDDDGGVATASTMVVVFDPSAGFVTGGGWIISAAGSYPADPALTGRANFGFVSKYHKGASVPDGQTEFQFQQAGLNFHSTSYAWLVVHGYKAQYQGVGSVNGTDGYGFTLTAWDGQGTGGGGVDRFRIKITAPGSSTVVYDNALGSPDDVDSANPTAISGGSIVIHK